MNGVCLQVAAANPQNIGKIARNVGNIPWIIANIPGNIANIPWNVGNIPRDFGKIPWIGGFNLQADERNPRNIGNIAQG